MTEINPKDYILVRDKESMLYLAKHRILQKNNWEKQIRELAERKGDMAETSEFLDLRDLLDSRKKVYDGRGSLVSTSEKTSLLDEMVAQRDPWRAEYFGNRFFQYNGRWYMESGFRVINNEIKATKIKEIRLKLMKNGLTSFKYFDEDGLATKLKGKEVYFYPHYFYPQSNNSVAWFNADSVGAYLGCCRNPSGSNEGLGVREARENFEV